MTSNLEKQKLHLKKNPVENIFSLSNNLHAKISARLLAESTSINPKQCRKLNFFPSRKKLKLNWVSASGEFMYSFSVRMKNVQTET